MTSGSKMPQRILLMCAKYNLPEEGRYLTNDLAVAMAEAGHEVTVLAIHWEAEPHSEVMRFNENGVRVLRYSPNIEAGPASVFKRIKKWFWSSYAIMPDVKMELVDEQFDIIVAFTPLVTTLAPVRWATSHFKSRNYVYNPDFFPFYHRANGSIPGGVIFCIAYLLEWFALRRFDVVGCMSPANARYYKQKFPGISSQRTSVVPLWGEVSMIDARDRQSLRRRFALPLDKKIILFGGQLIEGRGIEDVLAVSRLARDARPDLCFLFVGRGRLQNLVEQEIANGGSNVALLAPVPRADYLSLAAACDVGINATAAHVTVPTFPTKTIDYVRARLPIAASVEAASDYGEFIEKEGLGLAAPAGDHARLLAIIERLVDEPDLVNRIRQAGPSALLKHFDVKEAARRIVSDALA